MSNPSFQPDKYLDVLSVRLVRDFSLSATNTEIRNPSDAVELVGDWIREWDREVLTALFLAPNGSIIGLHICSIGSMTESMLSPAEILRCGILAGATQFILMHNHTGSLVPSEEDIAATDRMLRAGELLGVHMLDHIIVCNGRNGYYSIRENTEILNDIKIRYTRDPVELRWDSEPKIAEQLTGPAESNMHRRSSARRR